MITITDYSKVIPFYELGVSEEDKSELYIPEKIKKEGRFNSIRNTFVKTNGEFYYCKVNQEGNILNELIGSYLARIINLESAEYQVGDYCGEIYTLSKTFFDRNFDYFHALDYDGYNRKYLDYRYNCFSYFYCCDEDLRQFNNAILTKLLKLIVLDLKMGQIDRGRFNLMFRKNVENGELDLAPIYDYSYAYFMCDNYYNNPFMVVRCNALSIRQLVSRYPEMSKYIDMLKDIDIGDVISSIERDHGIKVSQQCVDRHIELNKVYSKVLKKV